MPESRPAGEWTTKDIDESENEYRVRLRSPTDFEEGSFRTMELDKEKGIRLIIGKLKGETNTTNQAYRFDKDKWDKDKIVSWLKSHSIKKSAFSLYSLTPPKAAYVPDKELWWTVFREGEQTDSAGTTQKFTLDRLQKIVNNTKQWIDKNNYPIINIDHNHDGEVYGMVDDIRLSKDNLGYRIEVRIAYFTNTAYSLLSQGKLPYRSIEISNDDIMRGFAMTGYPAVENMGVSAFSNNDNQSSVVYRFIAEEQINFMEDNMSEKEQEIKQPDLIDTPNPKPKEEESLLFTQAEREEYMRLKANEKQKDAKIEQLEKEFTAQRVMFLESEAKRKYTEELTFCKENKIPGHTEENIALLLVEIDKNQGKLEFSQGENIVEKRPIDIVKSIITAYSKQMNKYKEPFIDESKLEGKIYYDVDNEESFNTAVESYATQNNLSFTKALEELENKDMIVYKRR